MAGALMLSEIRSASGTLPGSKTTDAAQEVQSSANLPEWLLKLPDPLLFAGTVDPRLKINTPFAVSTQRTHGRVIVQVLDIGEFGVGGSLGEALEDLGKTIAELYLTLKAERDRLSPELADIFAKLGGHIGEVR
jgi:hypothetical protein